MSMETIRVLAALAAKAVDMARTLPGVHVECGAIKALRELGMPDAEMNRLLFEGTVDQARTAIEAHLLAAHP